MAEWHIAFCGEVKCRLHRAQKPETGGHMAPALRGRESHCKFSFDAQ